MRAVSRRFLFVGAIATATCAATTVPSLADHEIRLIDVSAANGTAIPGQYIVTLRQGTSAPDTAGRNRITTLRRFDAAVLNGFAARLTSGQLAALRRDPGVAAIEQDQIATITTTQGNPLPYGLDRIDQRSLPLSKAYTYSARGTGVNAYVIDSGIYTGHTEFGGRAKIAHDALGGNGQDCNGHGTHVAGIIGAKTYGVAKNVNLWAVRTLDCAGSAPYSTVIAAVNWVRLNAKKPAVANLSLGGPKSDAVNTAITNLSKSGVFVAVAAGNDGKNACNTTPASAGWVQAVGATDSGDYRKSWSSYGGCVDIHAPGSNIWSAYIGSTTATKALSGTSMASPYVAGVAALYKSAKGDASFPTIQQWLNTNATASKIKSLPS
ncbi:MAG: S8 family peptidase, partial [Actinomadura sp.]